MEILKWNHTSAFHSCLCREEQPCHRHNEIYVYDGTDEQTIKVYQRLLQLEATWNTESRVQHLVFRLMHEELEVFIPLGIQVIVNDLAPRHMAVPDSQSAHVQAKLSFHQHACSSARAGACWHSSRCGFA